MSNFSVTQPTLLEKKRYKNGSGPREKLLNSGAQTLSVQELLMLLLGSGGKHRSVGTLAASIEHVLHASGYAQLSIQQLQSIKGVGKAKACALLAAKELYDRFHLQHEFVFNSPTATLSQLHELQTSRKEMIIGLYLSARKTLVHKEVLAIGSGNQAILEPRDVFAPIRHSPVVSLILAHNHPSGNVDPSDDDIAFTERIRKAGTLLGVELLDHIIVTKTSHCSLKTLGLLGEKMEQVG